MSTVEIKRRLHEYIDHADDSVIRAAYELFQAHEGKDWWHELPDEAKKSFEVGIAQLDSGQSKSGDEVMRGIRKDFLGK